MADQPPRDLVLLKLEEIRKEQELMNRKIGTIADGMVSLRKQLDGVDQRLDNLDARMETMTKDMHLVTLAVDEHAHRRERIEERLGIGAPVN
jgi:uncharacterized coiled-coil DUF342 family protein